MNYLVLLALFCQVTITPPQAYVYALDPGVAAIATTNGRFEVELFDGCDNLGKGNVNYLPGSGGVVALGLPDGTLCNISIVQRLGTEPCAMTTDVCDINADPVYAPALVP